MSAAETLVERMGHRLNPEGQTLREQTWQLLRERLDKDDFQVAWGAGRLLTLTEAISDVHALSAMLELDPQSGRTASSERNFAARNHGVGPAQGAELNLTRREREILSLLCQRLSDGEIGEQLYISVRTVHNHVAHIFDKLEVHSRREAAALAARHGLA